MASKPVCKYGSECFRTSEKHLAAYAHPRPATAADRRKKAEDHGKPTHAQPKPTRAQPAKRRRDHDGNPKPAEADSKPGVASPGKRSRPGPAPDAHRRIPSAVEVRALAASEARRCPLERVYGMPFGSDLWQLWGLAKLLCPDTPCTAFKTLDMQLVGPFEVLAGTHALHPALFEEKSASVEEAKSGQAPVRGLADLSDSSDDEADTDAEVSGATLQRASLHMLHRHHTQPPEVLTVMRRGDGYVGLFRDDPAEAPVCVCAQRPSKSPVFEAVADDLWSAVLHLASGSKDESKSLMQAIRSVATQLGCDPAQRLANYQKRKKRLVAKPFHGLGLIVPVKNDVGYRPIPMSTAALKSMLKVIQTDHDEGKKVSFRRLDELVSLVHYANDEGDPGMALEVGLNLISSGRLFHPTAIKLLEVAYLLLERHLFKSIITHYAQADLD